MGIGASRSETFRKTGRTEVDVQRRLCGGLSSKRLLVRQCPELCKFLALWSGGGVDDLASPARPNVRLRSSAVVVSRTPTSWNPVRPLFTARCAAANHQQPC